MAKPNSTFQWATSGPITVPTSGKQAAGFAAGERGAAQYFDWLLNGAGQWFAFLSSQPMMIGLQELTAASGTYTPTAGTLAVRLRGKGAGGGGGYAACNTNNKFCAGAGGGSGWYFEKWIFPGSGTLITGGAF